MCEPLVVLLYAARFMPQDVLQLAAEFVPEGFRWVAVEQGAGDDARRAAFAEADFVLAYPGDPRPGELAVARSLKLFQLLSAGYDWLDLGEFRRRGITVARNDGSNAVSAAEHTVLLMLALLKMLQRHHEATAGGRWLAMQHALHLHELHGKTVGLVGLGRIGREVARRVRAFGANVRYYKPRRASDEEEAYTGAQYRPFNGLLDEADILSLHTPLCAATHRMIDEPALARMRRGSYLVNTARGALVDEPALIAALQTGQLAGAGLDVFVQEPPEPNSPLLALPNVVLTPHVAGTTRDAWLQRLDAAWRNIIRVAGGEAPLARIS